MHHIELPLIYHVTSGVMSNLDILWRWYTYLFSGRWLCGWWWLWTRREREKERGILLLRSGSDHRVCLQKPVMLCCCQARPGFHGYIALSITLLPPQSCFSSRKGYFLPIIYHHKCLIDVISSWYHKGDGTHVFSSASSWLLPCKKPNTNLLFRLPCSM